MLIFHVPLFILCGTYAFFNLTFPPSQQSLKSAYLLSTFGPSSEPQARITPPRKNERRSRLTFALLVFIGFALMSVINAVVGAAVVGYVLSGVYRAAGFYMST